MEANEDRTVKTQLVPEAAVEAAILRAKFSDDGKWIKFEDSTSWAPYLSPADMKSLGAPRG
jgi:hypothetical protein